MDAAADFDVRRWHRQFATAQHRDTFWRRMNPDPAPDEVRAAMWAAPRSTAMGDPTGLEAVFSGELWAAGMPALATYAATLPGSRIAIYLSVGAKDGQGYSCDADSQGACTLYRVTWNLRTMKAEAVDELASVVGTTGRIQPAVSPTGKWLAFVSRTESSPGSASSAYLVVQSTDSAVQQVVDPGGTSGLDRPQFPNFYGNHKLLYQKSTDAEPGDLWLATGAWDPARGSPSFVDWLGSRSSVNNVAERSWKDPHTHLSPTYPGAPGGPMVVTFGGAGSGSSTDDWPVVSSLDGSNRDPFASLGTNDDGDDIKDCHHPAWNAAGDRILCWAHEPASNRTGGGTAKALYTYSRAPGSWQQDPAGTPLVDPLGNAQLAALLPAFSGVTCDVLDYKYAEWCTDDRYVILTVYCEDGEEVTASRVVLVDLGVTPQAFFDVTAEVEALTGLTGDVRAIFATCSKAVPHASAVAGA